MTPRDASVTVAIPARNARRTLGICLDSIALLGADRVLVIDDHSTDDTPAIARAHGAEVIAAEGSGIAAARNVALAHCRTRLLAFVNADCTVDRGWLTALRKAIDETGAAIAGGKQIEVRRGTWAERWKALHLRQDLGDARIADPDYLSGGNLLIDTAAFTALRFDERHAVAYEDVDFCRRARAAGLRLVYEPAAIVHHDHHETLWTLPAKVWSYGASSASLGIRRRSDVVRGFVRMHRRPHDQVRTAIEADWRQRRLSFLLIDLYLLLASFSLFIAAAIAPSRLRAAPAALRQ